MGGRSVLVDHAAYSLTDAEIVKHLRDCGSMMFRSRWWSTTEPAPCAKTMDSTVGGPALIRSWGPIEDVDQVVDSSVDVWWISIVQFAAFLRRLVANRWICA